MKLAQQLSEPWANVVKLARVFGVSKGKTYNTRGGVKEGTEPRWLQAIAVNDQTFGLVEQWDELVWSPTISSKRLGTKLRLHPYWQELNAKYEARSEWLRPYSFRDTFRVRPHGLEIEATPGCAAMGHSMEVHRRSERTHEAQTVRDAYKRAS